MFFVIGRNCKKLNRSRERRLSPEELCFWVGSSEDFRLRSGMMQSQLAGLGNTDLAGRIPRGFLEDQMKKCPTQKGETGEATLIEACHRTE